MSTSIAAGASATPSTPPARANSTLSARSCRPIRPREAPSASRVLISRSRADPRARKRPATFRQARPNNIPVATNRTQSGCDNRRRRREWPCGAGISSSVEARNRSRRSAVTFGNSGRRMSSTSIALNHGWSPACACANVTPGRKRPSTCIQRARRFKRPSNPGMACADIDAGIHSDGTSPTSMPRNVGAATPTTVIGWC